MKIFLEQSFSEVMNQKFNCALRAFSLYKYLHRTVKALLRKITLI